MVIGEVRGGTDLVQDNQSYLRFSVEESVWFQRGQEVDELVSISLHPDISIEEHDEYVTIRGALKLTGEYRKDSQQQSESAETNEVSFERYLNEVNTREDGISELKHRFPVDITIPKNRIQNLDEVYVSVDSFDYELPGNQCLQLVADLSISGIYNQERQKQFDIGIDESDDVESSTLFNYDDEDEDDVFEIIEHHEHHDHHQFQNDLYADEVEDDDFYTPIEVEARKEAYHEDMTDTEHVPKVSVDRAPQIEMKGRDETDGWSYSSALETTSKGSTAKTPETKEDHEAEYNEKRDENALYLTKIFGKNDSEDFSRLKMYIVQTGDSVDSISERYNVTVQQLQRANHLDQEHSVHDGQILYIPHEKSRLFS